MQCKILPELSRNYKGPKKATNTSGRCIEKGAVPSVFSDFCGGLKATGCLFFNSKRSIAKLHNILKVCS